MNYRPLRNPGTSVSKRSEADITFLGFPLMSIKLHEPHGKFPTLSTSKISKNNILNLARNGKEIVEDVMRMIVDDKKPKKKMNFQTSDLEIVLERFQKNHRRLNYSALLAQILKGKEKETENMKHRCRPISRDELREFFRITLKRLLPRELFGKYKNHRKIMKAVYRLLDTARSEVFYLGPVVDSLHLQSIPWLKSAGEVDRPLVITKLVKWFFSQYFLPLLHSQFCVMDGSSLPHGRVFIKISDWCRIQKRYYKTIKRRGIVKRASAQAQSQSVPSIGILKLRATKTGARPVVTRSYYNDEKREYFVMLRFLEQINFTHFGLSSEQLFHERWNDVVRKQSTKRSKLYVTSCDISNAFGSILQDKLYNIIQILCKDLPNTLSLNWYTFDDSERNIKTSRRYFSNLQFSVPTKLTVVRKGERNAKVLHKNGLLEKIKECFFYKKVEVSGKKYLMKKGLEQGATLSPVLANIYYNYMIRENMSRFRDDRFLMKYADDLLYITEDAETAKEFLQIIKNGIPKYNCRFNETKTQTNVPAAGYEVSTYINYLGYQIHSETLEIEPMFPKSHLRYSVSHAIRAKNNLLLIFQRRLKNISSLKVTNLVLDCTINSDKTIEKIIKQACVRLAWRARILTLYMFQNLEESVPNIFCAIKSCNRKIKKRIIARLCSAGNVVPSSEKRKWCQYVSRTIVASYRKVFGSQHRLKCSFKSLLHKCI